MNPVMTEPTTGRWIAICPVDDVPLGEGRNVMVGELAIAIFRTEAGIYALDAACPHHGGPLADGIVADTCVTCPLHGKRFDLRTGQMVDGELAATAYEVRVDGGVVFVGL